MYMGRNEPNIFDKLEFGGTGGKVLPFLEAGSFQLSGREIGPEDKADLI